MANEVDIVRKAKQDLEASGQQWNTSCDAYRITNLAAQRAGWKVIQKTSGDNCQGRKVDGLIVNGLAIDCLQSAGPPVNANTPVWQVLGPQNALVAIDPLHDPIDDSAPSPPDPDNNDNLDMAYIRQEFIQINEKLDYLVGQTENLNNSIIQSNSQLNARLTQIVNDMEDSIQKFLPFLNNICRFQAAPTAKTTEVTE